MIFIIKNMDKVEKLYHFGENLMLMEKGKFPE
jgi:hypothetical protein